MSMTPAIAPEGSVLMVFAPHPDDETLGCGGYVAQKIDAGWRVVIVVLTMGEKLFSHGLGISENPDPETIRIMRREETLRATAILGVPAADVFFLDYEDRGLSERIPLVITRVVPFLQRYRPAEVLCTGPDEGHPDHKAASEIVRQACRVLPEVRLRWYITALRSGLSAQDLRSVQVIDIARQLARKTQAVAQFQTHLAIQSPRQSVAITKNFSEYLDGREILIEQ